MSANAKNNKSITGDQTTVFRDSIASYAHVLTGCGSMEKVQSEEQSIVQLIKD